mmetsp:Transcript_11274/g.17251  ORF Transcript_11274/g.17251 Transcript_11274/m.17251 type:complete len:199 (+) Transcript_11274:30-626(+)
MEPSARKLSKISHVGDTLSKRNSMSASASSRIRSNLLHKLGIERELADAPRQPQNHRRLLGDVTPFHEPLKREGKNETIRYGPWSMFFDPLAAKPKSLDSLSETNPKRRLTFDEEVVVIPIPTRDEYSDRIRERMWSSKMELQQNAHRNALEFAAEGWDWRTVAEDDQMLRCESGEKIHPIHIRQVADSSSLLHAQTV